MKKHLWKMSVPVTSIFKGPYFKVLPRRECELSFSTELENGGEKIETLVFGAVAAFRCTYLTALGVIGPDLLRESYGAVISVGESAWFQQVRNSHLRYCAPARITPGELQHLMITFDDGPCYEFICETFDVVA